MTIKTLIEKYEEKITYALIRIEREKDYILEVAKDYGVQLIKYNGEERMICDIVEDIEEHEEIDAYDKRDVMDSYTNYKRDIKLKVAYKEMIMDLSNITEI